MDGYLLLIHLFVIYTCVHSVVSGAKCPQLCMCSCSVNSYSHLDVDCHGRKGMEREMCIICEKIDNISSLDMSNSEITNIPSRCFTKCSKLKKLNLASNKLRTLSNDSFEGLKILRSLNLDNNMLLQATEVSSFDALETLESLNLLSIRNNSKEGNMTKHNICRLCNFLRNITFLDLSENNMKHVPPFCFENCLRLENLSLASNNIIEVDNSSFAGLSVLTVLNLDNNSFIVDGNVSHPELFLPLKLLQKLHIQKNTNVTNDNSSFTYLANIANGSLESLKNLFLDGLPNAVFGHQFKAFQNLTNLNFSGESSYCYMYSLTNSTFQNVNNTSLVSLHLSHCNISTIEAGTFKPLRELRYLNLSFNMALGFPTLRNVSYGLQFTQVKVFDYSKVYKTFGLTTQLNRCDVEFLQNTSIKEIHVNNNRLAIVEINAFMWMPNSLEIVYAEENKLKFGNFAFQLGCICNLTRIELNGQGGPDYLTNYNSDCKIKEKHIDTSGGCHINKSVCDKCKHPLDNCPYKYDLSDLTIPDKLYTVSVRNSNLHSESTGRKSPWPIRNSLRYLDISNNVFHRWTDAIVFVNNLTIFNLSHNFGSNISSEFFSNCPNIEHLDASNNRIGPRLTSDINGTLFQNLTRLRIFNMSNNWIEHLPFKIFKYITSLERLDISFNRLENVAFKFEHLRNLSQLYLQSNRLSTLPVQLMKHLVDVSEETSKFADIDLSNNLLDGSCKNIEFLSWIIEHKKYFSNVEEYQFLTDGGNVVSFINMSQSFDRFQNHCRNYTLILIVSVCFILIFILITIGGILHRYRWRLPYLYYMAKSRYDGYIPVRGNEDNHIYQYDIFISYANNDYRFATGEMYNK